MKYEVIKQLSEEEVESAILKNDPEELVYAVLSAALHSDNPEWAEDVCLRLSKHEHFNVRGIAILGFGHIARIHGKLNKKQVKPLIEAAFNDESDYVRDHADSAADDVELFLKWKISYPSNH
jgi:hypothetical protein